MIKYLMQLESVEARNFRNISGKMSCAEGLNIIFGGNGQGKTNWLEAIQLLSTAKSFKTSRLQEAIKFNDELAIVRGVVRQSEGISRELQATLENNTKTLTVNKKKETAAQFQTQLQTFIFYSDRLAIVRSSPEARRKFLDEGIVSVFPAYIQTTADYGRVLRQKNSLLQKARQEETPLEKIAELIEPWNEQLIPLAARIHNARARFVERLNETLEKKLFAREEVSIRYASSLEGKGDLSDYNALLAVRLKLRKQAEVFAGYSLIGPHRDDLEICFDGRDLRKFGSSGQQRSALIILLLACISVFYEQQDEYPIFLLDDLDAELDYRRIGRLLEFLEDKTQTFVTTSKDSFVERFGDRGLVHSVDQGIIASGPSQKILTST